LAVRGCLAGVKEVIDAYGHADLKAIGSLERYSRPGGVEDERDLFDQPGMPGIGPAVVAWLFEVVEGTVAVDDAQFVLPDMIHGYLEQAIFVGTGELGLVRHRNTPLKIATN
jgi:hypothetical protein